jgi:tetratricopeptide (TPR) repeat protein
MTVDVQVDSRIAKCQKILDSDPNSQIFASLAEAYRKKGDLERAFQVCQDGLRIHPDYGAAHVVMAKVNLDRGLYDWAEAEVNRAIEADGNNRNIELLLAEIYIYKGEYQAAIKLLKKLHSVDPHNEHISRLLDIAKKIPQEQQTAVGSPVSEAAQPTQIEPPPESAPETTESVRLGPAELLREALSIERTQGALYINSEGLVMESRWNSELDAATCGAALAEVNKFLNQELMKVSFGRVDTVLVETGKMIFYLIQIATGMFLVVGDAKVNLGTLRMKMAELIKRTETS